MTLLMNLRDMEAPLPKAAFSISGAFDSTLTDPEQRALDDRDPLLSRDALHLWQSRIQRIVKLDDPQFSPVFADLSALPPILLLAGSDEIWRNDSTRIGRKRASAGGVAETRVFQGMWHVWPMLPELPESKAALGIVAKFLREYV